MATRAFKFCTISKSINFYRRKGSASRYRTMATAAPLLRGLLVLQNIFLK
jgi:hypothetical protein